MKAPILGVAALFALAACSSNSPSFSGGSDDGSDAAKLILRIEEVGGFVPLEYTFGAQPSLVVMSDGRIYTTPAMIEIYPPPVQTSYEVRRVESDGLAAIRAAAIEAGLTQDGTKGPDENGAQVADATTTVFTYVAEDGTEHKVEAYALGFLGNEDTAERKKLEQFRNDLGDLQSMVPEGSIIDEGSIEPASEIRVGVSEFPAQESANDDSVSSGPDEPMDLPLSTPIKWPLSEPLSTFGKDMGDDPAVERCGVLTGDDLDTFLEAAASANTETPWTSEGTQYKLILDPVTPDEEATC